MSSLRDLPIDFVEVEYIPVPMVMAATLLEEIYRIGCRWDRRPYQSAWFRYYRRDEE